MRQRNDNKMLKYVVTLTIICAILFAFAVFEVHKQDYIHKIAKRIGIVTSDINVDNPVTISWTNCLDQLNCDCDIVFFGDSITRQGRFADYFTDKKICNLGLDGDSISGMIQRVHMVEKVSPEKIFIMGGINDLKTNNISALLSSYSELLDEIRELNPNAKLYVQSLLPISAEIEGTWYNRRCNNRTILEFNENLKNICEQRGLTYIDLFSVYELDGFLDSSLTVDGLHITAYEKWADAISSYVYN